MAVLTGIAVFMSGFALSISLYALWKQHLKAFQLACSFQSAVFDGSEIDGFGFNVALSVTLTNEGAKSDYISSWALLFRNMDEPRDCIEFHGVGIADVGELIHALKTRNLDESKVVLSGMPSIRLGSGEQRELGLAFIAAEPGSYISSEKRGFANPGKLTVGRYDLELWCFVKKWARYHKVGFETDERRLKTLMDGYYFVNNFVPAFDSLKPDLDPKPRGQ